MKKGLLGVLLCLLAFLIAGCETTGTSSVDYQVYYLSSTGTRLVEENFTPGDGTPKTITEELLDKIGNPTAGSDHVKVLPDSVRVQKCVLGSDQISIDFSKEYYDMDRIREVLVRAAFVKTLLQVPQVQSITITVDGESLIDGAGDVVGPMTKDTFIDTQSGINSYQYTSLTLYFAEETGEQIVKEMRNVHYSSNTTLEKVVVEELIKGPVNARLQAVVPSNTKVLGIQVEDDVCTVNFDSTFNQAPENSNVTPRAAIYAIVDALCDVCQVKQVVIQVEGTTEVSFRNELSLNEPFTRNSEIIQPVASEGEDLLEPSVGGDRLLKNYFF